MIYCTNLKCLYDLTISLSTIRCCNIIMEGFLPLGYQIPDSVLWSKVLEGQNLNKKLLHQASIHTWESCLDKNSNRNSVLILHFASPAGERKHFLRNFPSDSGCVSMTVQLFGTCITQFRNEVEDPKNSVNT